MTMESINLSQYLNLNINTKKTGQIIIDKTTNKIIALNNVLIEWLGYEKKELLNCSIEDFIEVFEQNETLVSRLIKKDGTFVEAQLSATFMENNNKEYYLLEIKNSNQQHQEDQLNFLQQLIDIIPSPVFFKDINGLYQGCNKAFENYIGHSREELLGKSAYYISPKNLADKYLAKDKELFKNKGAEVFESSILYADDSLHEVIINKAVYFDNENKVAGLIGIITDITELKQFERKLKQTAERFRSIYEDAAIGIAIVNEQGRFLQCNAQFQKMLAYNENELRDKLISDITHPNDISIMNFLYQELFSGRRMNYQTEKRYIRKDGQLIWVRLTASQVQTAPGEPKLVIGMAEDITKHKQVEKALITERKRLFSLLDELPAAIFLLAKDYTIRYSNRLSLKQFGNPGTKRCYEHTFGLSKPCKNCIPFKVFENNTLTQHEFKDKNGRKYHFYNYPYTDVDGSSLVLSLCIDITDRKQAEEFFKKYKILSDCAHDFFLFINGNKKIIEANQAAVEALGYSRDDLLTLNINDLLALEALKLNKNQMEQAYQNGILFETVAKRKDGSTFPIEVNLRGTFIGNERVFLSVGRDITNRKRFEQKLQYLASHDPLTNISNRYSLEEYLTRFVAKAKLGRTGVLLLIDLDNFKMVNDTYGHAAGDEVLIALVNTLRLNLREEDFIARFGGDEFVVLLDNTTVAEAMLIAEKLRNAVDNNAFCLCTFKTCFNLTISIGAVLIDGNQDAQKLLSIVDAALYVAKESGRNSIKYLEADEFSKYVYAETNEIIGLIKQALREDKFISYYQPVVKIDNGTIAHYEALTRLIGKNREIILPGIFIPVAERYGLMPQIDQWVVRNSLAALVQNPEIKIFINISGMSLGQDTLLESIEKQIRDSKIDPLRLGFEITETTAIKDLPRAERWIRRLKKLGCQFALDDFGMGFSSFSYLRVLPVDIIKIDGSFIRDINDNPTQHAILQAIINIARTLGKKTIAEYVENKEILQSLHKLNIDYGQGYFLGKPAPEFQNSSRY
ncbi:diguanylate cyclase/phosphodiesterase with PAS/PAC sensor(s) [Desulfofarcimen acetoxidans DSM 771]|uniref:Diguanylate cyclase/phosphodiesterase with PAS/PAC sensor(S) n=2 Tax=Desulfofarcimen acetoxidans TaxID=58138 RepID=C8VWV7_DESAS|nr:diguanylate cyclase/phosphodiesterase with PAS/PAC sensor(s) [Desulfofarcimen acetoxidans DSM 771]